MKTVGLITEYNPFHNGHKYHIEQAKSITGADNVIVIMSGDYVQRGTPAIMPKRLRTEMALEAGASAVLNYQYVIQRQVPNFLQLEPYHFLINLVL